MYKKYIAVIMGRYDATERTISIDALNLDHANRIAWSKCDVCEYVFTITLSK